MHLRVLGAILPPRISDKIASSVLLRLSDLYRVARKMCRAIGRSTGEGRRFQMHERISRREMGAIVTISTSINTTGSWLLVRERACHAVTRCNVTQTSDDGHREGGDKTQK